MKDNKEHSHLHQHLKYLKLPFIIDHYQDLAAQAARKNWPHVNYLDNLVSGEAALRRDRSIERRIRMARFPLIKTLDQFNWAWPKKINRLQVQNLFRLNFVQDKCNVIFLGGVGLGKSIWPLPWAMPLVLKTIPSFLQPLSISSTPLPQHRLKAV